MQKPPYLQPGATVAITCPSGYIPKELVLTCKKVLEQWGYRVVLGDTVAEGYHYFSAPDEVRLQDLQQFLDDDNIDAILMGRGGYGLSRIIDDINFSHFIEKPKWICGFSDITVLHSHINSNYGIATIHGPMCSSFNEKNADEDFLKSIRQIWEGKSINYPMYPSSHNIEGVASGILVGGNLAMLAHLSGSASAINSRDKILFIEDVGEHLYNVDRMLINLKRAGTLQHATAVVCGGFTDMEDTTRPFGKDIYEIISEHIAPLHIPLCFDLPSGHIDQNYALCLGAHYSLSIESQHVSFEL